jgi:wyosine [tRNA(Phe)-imidazoG37] synthetase (radical SAM superfamily)
MRYRHLFGPVPSRRLGYSLGVDLVPYKYCPLNCVYCEVQRTTHLTTERSEFFPLGEILGEVDDFLSSKPRLDYITFSGAGEPTLYSRIGEIVAHIKENHAQYPLALLTNGILLSNPGLRREIIPCDLILPSLDAATQEAFEKINRPRPGLGADVLIQGLTDLRREYSGQIWLEVFIIEGINDTDGELEALAGAIRKIGPDRVQINSLDRPGTEPWVTVAGIHVLNRVQRKFQQALELPVEIIAKVHSEASDHPVPDDLADSIAATLGRRPCTAEDLSEALGIHLNEVSKYLRQLHEDGRVDVKREERGVFYSWKH